MNEKVLNLLSVAMSLTIFILLYEKSFTAWSYGMVANISILATAWFTGEKFSRIETINGLLAGWFWLIYTAIYEATERLKAHLEEPEDDREL